MDSRRRRMTVVGAETGENAAAEILIEQLEKVDPRCGDPAAFLHDMIADAFLHQAKRRRTAERLEIAYMGLSVRIAASPTVRHVRMIFPRRINVGRPARPRTVQAREMPQPVQFPDESAPGSRSADRGPLLHRRPGTAVIPAHRQRQHRTVRRVRNGAYPRQRIGVGNETIRFGGKFSLAADNVGQKYRRFPHPGRTVRNGRKDAGREGPVPVGPCRLHPTAVEGGKFQFEIAAVNTPCRIAYFDMESAAGLSPEHDPFRAAERVAGEKADAARPVERGDELHLADAGITAPVIVDVVIARGVEPGLRRDDLPLGDRIEHIVTVGDRQQRQFIGEQRIVLRKDHLGKPSAERAVPGGDQPDRHGHSRQSRTAAETDGFAVIGHGGEIRPGNGLSRAQIQLKKRSARLQDLASGMKEGADRAASRSQDQTIRA